MSTKHYPILFIQCDWNEVLRIPNSEAWISVKYRNESSLHGKITTSSLSADGKLKHEITPDFSIVNQTSNMLTVKHQISELITTFVSPMKTFHLHDKGVISVNAAENAMVVSSSEDDKVIVWDSRTGEKILDLKGHGGPAYKCRFFPSGVVILTAGADGSLKVWSAENGINPVTLSGHSMGVTDAAIVDRGKNVISVSKDGKVKLWDVGESKCLADLLSGAGVINACCILTTSVKNAPVSSREVGTDDKLVVVGSESNTLHCIHVALREVIFRIKFDSPVNSVCALGNDVLVGCEDGKVTLVSSVDGSNKNEWWESSSPVLSLQSLHNNKFAVGKQDGTCILYSLDHPSVRVQLTGPDCDPIRDLSFNGRWVFTACRDHFVRKYDYNQLNVHFK